MSELTNINQVDFKKRVTEHVINTFGSLIPEDQFKSMVDAEITAFFNTPVMFSLAEAPQKKYSYYGASPETQQQLNVPITPFRQMVWAELRKLVNVRLESYMSDTNATNPVNKLLDSLFSIQEFEQHQVMTTQQLMLAMSGQMMRQVMKTASVDARQAIAQVFRDQGYHDLAMSTDNSALHTSSVENVKLEPDRC